MKTIYLFGLSVMMVLTTGSIAWAQISAKPSTIEPTQPSFSLSNVEAMCGFPRPILGDHEEYIKAYCALLKECVVGEVGMSSSSSSSAGSSSSNGVSPLEGALSNQLKVAKKAASSLYLECLRKYLPKR